MRRTLLCLASGLAVLLVPSTTWATWSVVAVDMSTRRVVIASAAMLDVPAVGPLLAVTPVTTRAAVVGAMAGHIRGKAAMVGLFKRQ